MNKRLLSTLFLFAPLSGTFAQNLQKQFADAQDDWQKGNYISALTTFKSILNSPAGDAYFDRIALTTGELYQVTTLTTDGKTPRFSPGGKFAFWDRVADGKDQASYYRTDTKESGSIEGRALSVLQGDIRVFLRTVPDDSLRAAIKKRDDDARAAAAAGAPVAGGGARPTPGAMTPVTRFTALNTFLFSYDPKKKKEKQLLPKGWVVNELVGAESGTRVFFSALKPGAVYPAVFSLDIKEGKPVELVSAKAFPINLRLDRSGSQLLFEYGVRFPLVAADVRPEKTEGAIVYDLATSASVAIPGKMAAADPAFSSFLFVGKKDNLYTLSKVSKADPTKAEILYSTEKLLAEPAFSPDGSKVTFAVKVLDDYEIFCTDLKTSKTTQVTAEIQHDHLPQFVNDSVIVAAKGEPRHRRSYLYNLNTGTSLKLFHNNTVRTLVPEYDWDVHPNGGSIMITAERDGNTITPERGVYLVDLTRKITRTDLSGRIDEDIRSETALRNKGEEMFATIRDAVKDVSGQVSVHRIYDYENSLAHFGSKHITMPGNAKAIQFLYDQYKSFGYEPVIQSFQPTGRSATTGKTANVYAVLKGTVNPELVYVVSSHFDSVVAGPGADDDASGTSALLEAARVMAGHPMPCTIIFASFTGEEAGLLGSKEFVRQAKENKMLITGALNNDMVGWANDARLDNTIRYSNPGIRDVQHASAFLFSNLITYDVVYYKSTDAQSYYDAYGDIVGGIGSYPVLGSPYYHQWNDFLETINHQLVAEVSKTTVATLMLLASSPSRIKGVTVEKKADGSSSVSWQPSPEKDIDHYVVEYGKPGQAMTQKETRTPQIDLGKLEPGTRIQVKAWNTRKMGGWDWAIAP